MKKSTEEALDLAVGAMLGWLVAAVFSVMVAYAALSVEGSTFWTALPWTTLCAITLYYFAETVTKVWALAKRAVKEDRDRE